MFTFIEKVSLETGVTFLFSCQCVLVCLFFFQQNVLLSTTAVNQKYFYKILNYEMFRKLKKKKEKKESHFFPLISGGIYEYTMYVTGSYFYHQPIIG